MRDSFEGISVFVEAAEAGSFAKAADILSLTRSAVGKSVARLEARLGVRLFNRTTRTQSLTEDGQLYYERCLRAMGELRTGQALLDTGRHEVVGRLRVSMPVLFGRYCAAPILRSYARDHPDLELDLSFSDRRVDLIGDGLDLVIRNGSLVDSTTLTARRLVGQRKALCVSPAYLEAFGQPISITDLADHALLGYRYGDRDLDWQLPDTAGKLVAVPVRSRLRCDDLAGIADAALEGMGIAWLPYWLIRDCLHDGSLVEIWSERPAAVVDCYAVWPETQYLPLRTRLAIDALAEGLPSRVEQ